MQTKLAQSADRLVPFIVFAIALLVSFVVRHTGLQLLNRKATGRPSGWVALLNAIRIPSLLWCVAASIEIALRYSEFPEKYIGLADKIIVTALILSFTLATAAMAVRWITIYGEERNLPFAAAGLARTLVRAIIFLVGAAFLLIELNMWKSVTPILTALGVGGLAVALALQDTMANFFAGVHIMVETPIALGDFIRLQSGEEGTVSDIGWRTTRVRTGANNTIVIPNVKITSGILTNFSLPDKRAVTEVTIYAAQDSDPDKIAGIALDVASETSGVLKDPPPTVLFDPGVLPTHIQMKLMVNVASQQQAGGVVSAVRVGILQRFREEGVALPSTSTTVVVRS